jgi:putative exosortase-associated protein (TIGR04073 family)
MRFAILTAVAALSLTTRAHALGPADDRVPPELTKFARGAANALVGLPAEIVGRTIVSAHSEEGLQGATSFVGHALMGGVYGLGWGVLRMGAGLVDVFTFPVALNSDNAPIVPLDPDYPF